PSNCLQLNPSGAVMRGSPSTQPPNGSSTVPEPAEPDGEPEGDGELVALAESGPPDVSLPRLPVQAPSARTTASENSSHLTDVGLFTCIIPLAWSFGPNPRN